MMQNGRLRIDKRASVSVLMAVSAIPLLLAAGVGIDMARLAMARSAFQAATDDAALAGAAAYTSSGSTSAATTAATNYFNAAVAGQGGVLTNVNVSVTPAPGMFNATIQSNNVTVTASASMSTTFLGLGGVKSVALNTTATAANPWIVPSVPTSPNWMQPVVQSGFLGSNAGDWNSVYMYAVPMTGPNNTPNYGILPPISQLYEIASTCNAASDPNWTSSSRCNGSGGNSWPGAVVPTTQTFPPIAPDQPIAFILINMTSGVDAVGANQYGSVPGDIRILATALVASQFNQGPAALDDNNNFANGYNGSGSGAYGTPDYWSTQLFPNSKANQNRIASHPDAANTNYSTVNNSTTPNCALQISVADPANPQVNPPVPAGSCFALGDQRTGLQYANLTCAQMAGRTFIYWWNDMGGNPDDKDYRNMIYAISCVPAPANVTQPNLYSGTAAPTTVTVALIK